MKNCVMILIVLSLGIGGWYFFSQQKSETNEAVSPLDATYRIDGESITLSEGMAEVEEADNEGVRSAVAVFGEPAYGDIDQDGDTDAVLILTRDLGGSGTFYYAALAVNVDGSYRGTDTILLGDRIAPQTFSVRGNRAEINYAVRVPTEPMVTEPSIGKTLHLQFDPETLNLIEVAVNFEGEADPERLTLSMHPWVWIKTTYNNDTEVVPHQAGAFTMVFKDDGSFSATTDCNSMAGSYEVTQKQISFKDSAVTLKYCEGSQEQEFFAMLEEVSSFLFTSRGELVFELPLDTGSMIFRGK